MWIMKKGRCFLSSRVVTKFTIFLLALWPKGISPHSRAICIDGTIRPLIKQESRTPAHEMWRAPWARIPFSFQVLWSHSSISFLALFTLISINSFLLTFRVGQPEHLKVLQKFLQKKKPKRLTFPVSLAWKYFFFWVWRKLYGAFEK